jgi:hypothetical protein
MGFVDPAIAIELAIRDLTPTVTIGIFGLVGFILLLFQLRVDWKQRSDPHDQTAKCYGVAKLKLRPVLMRDPIVDAEADRALRYYYALGERLVAVPERDFNRLRQRHLRKIEVSKTLELYPRHKHLAGSIEIVARS